MRILVIDDDVTTVKLYQAQLHAEDYQVESAHDGATGIELAQSGAFDIILLDLDLQDMHGLDVLRTLRVGKINTPVMIVSGTTDIDMKVKTFSGGADEFVTKPYHRQELVARIQALVRRSKGHPELVITTGNLVVNLDQKTVQVNGRDAPLTPMQYQMLELLALHKGTTVTKKVFMSHLYGVMNGPPIKIIDVFICKLRKKLAGMKGGAGYKLETVWGRGYVLRTLEEGQVAA
jgi:two-component system cell cycle response regulator CtrA